MIEFCIMLGLFAFVAVIALLITVTKLEKRVAKLEREVSIFLDD